MRVLNTIAQMRRARETSPGSVGFVPTMGYLHEGHLSLVRLARAQNEVVVVSIYVNPTQFGPNEDLATYPRDLERDLRLLRKEKVDFAFAPESSEMYPEGFSTSIDLGPVAQPLEGKHRPGHFRGVATIVAKLFNIVQPTRAYFGQKDAQQAAVIRRLVRDLNFDLELVVGPTVREPDGLAMSSRNVYLNPEERRAATVLSRALKLAQQLWSGGERAADRIRQPMRQLIQAEPLATLDYVSVADPRTLQELSTIKGEALVSLAVRIGKTRLIDNTMLPPSPLEC